MQMPFQQWADTFKPIQNHICKSAAYDGTMFETIGTEKEFVAKQSPMHIWTLIAHGEEWTIIEGWHVADRLGYFVTTMPHDNSGIEVAL